MPDEPKKTRGRAAQEALDQRFAAEAERSGKPLDEVRREYFAKIGGNSISTRKIMAIEARVRELVDSAPPLTPAQIERLSAIIRIVG